MKVLSRKNLPVRIPIHFGITLYLLLKQLNASELAWGIAITLWSILFIACIIQLFGEDYWDVINNQPTKS